MGSCIVGLDLNRLLIFGDCLLKETHSSVGTPEIEMDSRYAWIEGYDVLPLGNGLFKFTGVDVPDGQAMMGLYQIGTLCQGPHQLDISVSMMSFFAIGQSQVNMGHGVIRIDTDGLLILRDGFVQHPLLFVRKTKDIVSFRPIGMQLHGPLPLIYGAFDHPDIEIFDASNEITIFRQCPPSELIQEIRSPRPSLAF